MDRREILKRAISVNTYWGIGNASCHDIETPATYSEANRLDSNEDYLIAVDLNTGELSLNPELINK